MNGKTQTTAGSPSETGRFILDPVYSPYRFDTEHGKAAKSAINILPERPQSVPTGLHRDYRLEKQVA